MIGVFDSGIGGLTVVREIRRVLKNIDIIYFGDTARLPYGNKSKSMIIQASRRIVEFLMDKGAGLIVIACHSASSNALPVLEKEFKIPIIGVIKPSVEDAIAVTKNRKVGVIGTVATIESKSYFNELKKRKIEVYQKSCPLFVPLVEEGLTDGFITEEIAKRYLNPLKKKGIDTLILGCTHYPLLKDVISKIMKNVYLIDPAKSVAEEVKKMIDDKGNRKLKVYLSDKPRRLKEIAKRFLGFEIKKIEIIDLTI